MKKVLGAAVLLLLTAMCFGQAKDQPKTITTILDSGVKQIEKEFVSTADAMPADKYDFAPTQGEFKGVRTFAQQVKHVAATNYMFGGWLLSEKPPVDTAGENGPDSLKTKADIMKYLNDSYAYAHKAVNTVTADNATAEIQSPFGKLTKMGTSMLIVGHGFDHYGQMVEYLRMNGIVPPPSRGQ